MSRKKISFAGPWITEKEISYVADAAKNGFYETYDGYVKRLESRVNEYVGTKYAIATHCCTLALHLACESLGLKEGDEVICTDFSWVATAHAIAYTGAKPVFVDIQPHNWCIDPEAIRAAITPKSKAIMLVHCFGQAADMGPIMKIAKEHNLAVIEDAAPAMGVESQGKKVGSFGDFGCFSFHGAKLTVSGEGGILLTNDEKLFEKARFLSSMGRTDSQAVFWSDGLGFQYTIANLTAALALAQMERVEELIQRKRDIFSWYESRLKNVPGVRLIREAPGTKANYCYPSLLLESSVKADRDTVLRNLKEVNVHCRPAFPRMSRFPMYEARFPNPVATEVERRGISLASAANVTEEDVDFVCKTFLQSLGL